MQKPKVGMAVYLVPINKFHSANTIEYTVKRIGRKYFEVWENNKEYTAKKFELETLRQVTNYAPDWEIYFSKQEVIDKEETIGLICDIEKLFRYGNLKKISLNQLRQIESILQDV